MKLWKKLRKELKKEKLIQTRIEHTVPSLVKSIFHKIKPSIFFLCDFVRKLFVWQDNGHRKKKFQHIIRFWKNILCQQSRIQYDDYGGRDINWAGWSHSARGGTRNSNWNARRKVIKWCFQLNILCRWSWHDFNAISNCFE